MKKVFLAIVAFLFLLLGCHDDTVQSSGGSSSETVVGQVYYPDQTEAKNASYILKESRYLLQPNEILSMNPTLPIYEGITDSRGKFAFTTLDPGDYSLEVAGKEGLGAIVQFSVKSGAGEKVLKPDTLKPTGFIKGVVIPAEPIPSDSIFSEGYVRVFGMVRGASLDSNGQFVLGNLPPGRYYIRAESNYPYPQSVELASILVRSDDTTDVRELNLNRVLTHNVTSVVPNGLIAYWPMEQGGAILTDAVGVNHGSLLGGVDWVQGQNNGALWFDGVDGKVNLPFIYLNEDFTISTWVYLTGAIGNDDAVLGHKVIADSTGTNINFYQGFVRLYSGDIGPVRDPLIANSIMPKEMWKHITISRMGDSLSLYIDGVLDATGNWLGTFTVNSIGVGQFGTLEGMLDDLRIYDRALSGGEIQELVIETP